MSDVTDAIAALDAKNPQARELARLASIAVQIEPELLRRLRLQLLESADASAEADLWFSELVDSKSPNAMVLRSDVRAQLQQELAASAANRDAAAKIIAEMHTGASEVVRIQEQVDALSLRNDANARADIDKLLQPIVRTLYETDHAGLARWAARAFAQFRPAAQTRPAAWSMMRAAAVQLTSSARTMPKVYVSSTYQDLAEHRGAVMDALRQLGFSARASENEPERERDAIASALERVDAADLYVCILGFRYGFVPRDPERNPQGYSITELEYRRALMRHLPVFMFLMVDGLDERSRETRPQKLASVLKFRKAAEAALMAPFSYLFSSVSDLKMKVIQAFTRLLAQEKTSTGWQAVESSIRALPLTPVYMSVSRHSIEVGTEVIESAARIDVPATEPLLLNVSWEGGSQLVSFAAGQSIEFPADPHALTATTILGESHEIRTAGQLHDWAIVLSIGDEGAANAELFRKWLVAPEGGAVPQEQCAFRNGRPGWPGAILVRDLVAQWEIQLAKRPRRRFYLYVSGAQPYSDSPFLTYTALRDALNAVLQSFREVVVFADLPNGGTFKPDKFEGVWFVGVARVTNQAGSFTSRLIEALNGGAIDDRGVVSDAGLINNPLLDAEWSVSLPLDLVRSDDFVTAIEIRNRIRSEALDIRILDAQTREVARIRHEGTVRKRALRGRYILDLPALSLVQRFETGDDDAVAVVDVERRQQNHWIIIAGSGAGEIPIDQQHIAIALSRRLAGSGFLLFVGDWPGIDEIVLKAYLDTLARLDIGSRRQVRQFTNSRRRNDRVDTINVANENEEYDAPLREASALVAIGGLGGTREYARRATARQIPILPVASTGGDAAIIYEGLPASPDWLTRPIATPDDADAMAVRIVAWLLDHLPPGPPNESATSA
jgi:hypothetical protein